MTMLKTLCKTFVQRAEHQGLKGKARDTAAIEFMVGAFAALEASKHPEANHVGTYTQLAICTRGYSEVKRVAEAEDKSAAA